MPPLAYFGIESSGLSLVIDLLILFVVVLYLSLIYWTYADARRRIADPMLVACATAASLFPFVGTIIYVILRPPEYLEDVRERDLEMQAAEARLHELDSSLCPHCDYRIERDFVRCPSCLRKLKERCVGCSRPLERTWAICPYCETEVPAATSARRAAARRRATPAGEPSRARRTQRAAGRTVTAELADGGDGRDGRDGRDGAGPAGADADEDLKGAPMAASEAARNPRPARPGRRAGPPAPEA
jgi:hypothetical protein